MFLYMTVCRMDISWFFSKRRNEFRWLRRKWQTRGGSNRLSFFQKTSKWLKYSDDNFILLPISVFCQNQWKPKGFDWLTKTGASQGRADQVLHDDISRSHYFLPLWVTVTSVHSGKSLDSPNGKQTKSFLGTMTGVWLEVSDWKYLTFCGKVHLSKALSCSGVQEETKMHIGSRNTEKCYWIIFLWKPLCLVFCILWSLYSNAFIHFERKYNRVKILMED